MAKTPRAITVTIEIELSRLRKSRKWLAEKMKVSGPTVYNQLDREDGPTEDFLVKVAKALGIGYGTLLERAESEYELAQKAKRRMQEPLVCGPHRPSWISEKLKAKLQQ